MQAPSAPHDHSAHDHDEEHEGELFPRVLTAKLVGEREEQRAGREQRQVWWIAAGLAILALGLPLSRVVEPTGFSAPLPREMARLLSEWTGVPGERIVFGMAAALLGLSIPLIASTLRKVGFLHQALLPATLIATLSPLGWIGATTANDFYLGVFTSAWLVRELFARSGPGRLILVYGICIGLHPDPIWLLPAVALGAAAPPVDGGNGASPRIQGALVTAVGGAVLLMSLYLAGALAEGAPWPLGSGSGGAVTANPSRIMLVLGGLGIGLWGLIGPWARAAEEVSRPPVWCLAMVLVPLPVLALGGSSMGSWLVPIAALGLGDLVQRGRSDSRSLQIGLSLLTVQLLLTAGLAWRWESQDPNRAWRETARAQLEPGDLVVSDHPLHLHLLVERWGLEACRSTAPDLPERAAGALEAGRRVVRDSEAAVERPAALAGTPLFHLTEAGMTPP